MGLLDTLDQGKQRLFGFADDLSNVLDFGINAPPQKPVKAENPEKDLTEIDRSNPVNVEFAPLGVNRYIWYGAAAVVALVILKKTKVL